MEEEREFGTIEERLNILEKSQEEHKKDLKEIKEILNTILSLIQNAKGIMALLKLGGTVLAIGSAIATAYYTFMASTHMK